MWGSREHEPGRYRNLKGFAGHPIADRDGTVLEHRLALFNKIGVGPHKCHWCRSDVAWMPSGKTKRGALVVDHLDNDGLNNDPSNLVPSCHPCNCHRDNPQTIGDGELFVIQQGSRHRAVKLTCHLCGAEFLKEVAASRDMRGNKNKYCSRSCARRGPRKDQARTPAPVNCIAR